MRASALSDLCMPSLRSRLPPRHSCRFTPSNQVRAGILMGCTWARERDVNVEYIGVGALGDGEARHPPDEAVFDTRYAATPLEFLSTGPWGLVYRPPAVPPPHSPPRVVRTDQAGHPISYATYRFRSRCVLAGHGHGHRPLPVLCCRAGAADSALSALSPPSFVSRLTPPRAAPPLSTLPSRRPRHPLIAADLSSNPVRSGCRLVHCKTMTLDT
ncbi:hypothetical protein B0H14DRAFT_2964820, partial [Mycena olivaceomarginata]